MRKLARAAAWFLTLNTAAWLTGRYLGKRMSSGDESSDDFTLAVFYSGESFESRAAAFRSGRATVVMGGLMLDLRDAVLDEAGAHLGLEVTLGGAMVRVSDEWAVSVDEERQGAEVHVDVTEPEALTAEAPQLHIRVTARGGGITITSAPGKLYDSAPSGLLS
jgi:hypothetical protein